MTSIENIIMKTLVDLDAVNFYIWVEIKKTIKSIQDMYANLFDTGMIGPIVCIVWKTITDTDTSLRYFL